MIDIDAEIRSALAEAAKTTAIPIFPGVHAIRTAPARKHRRRFGVATAATCLVLGSGAGVAAAAVAGVFTYPPPAGAFAYGVPGTARTVLEVQGPSSSTLRVRVADSRLGGTCSKLTGIPGGLSLGSCENRTTVMSFGLDQISSVSNSRTVGLGAVVFSATVPGATTVQLSFDDGTTRPLAVARNYTIGWFTDEQSLQHPELIGYDATGSVIGRTNLISAAQQRGVTCRQHC